MSHSQYSCAYVPTSVLGTGQGELLEPQVAQKVGSLAQLVTPVTTVLAFPCRSIDCAWWPLMGPFPWMVTLHPCRRSAASQLDMVPWSSWMNAMPLASWGPQDGGSMWHPRPWVGLLRVGGKPGGQPPACHMIAGRSGGQ